jgi:hypothetical protein
MQNGGPVPPFLIFCPHAFRLPRKKTKKWLAATGHHASEIFLQGDFEGYPPSRVKKK